MGEATAETIAATPENIAPTSYRSISGFTLPAVIRDNEPFLNVSFLKLPPPPCTTEIVMYLIFEPRCVLAVGGRHSIANAGNKCAPWWAIVYDNVAAFNLLFLCFVSEAGRCTSHKQ